MRATRVVPAPGALVTVTVPPKSSTRSLGLKGMRERFAYFGGSLEITSPARGGTRLRIQVPVPAEDGTA